MNKLLIVGAGSVGKFIAYNLGNFTEKYKLIGFLDDDPSKINQPVAGSRVLGNLELLQEYSGKGYSLVFGIAFPTAKLEILDRFPGLDFHFPSMISGNAWISNGVKVGMGCIIYPGVSINYETEVGDFVVINMNCAIGHNCTLGKHSSLAPGVCLAGHTRLGDAVDVGIGVSTVQNVVVGSGSVIGGQSMLIRDVDENDKIIGIPGRSIKMPGR